MKLFYCLRALVSIVCLLGASLAVQGAPAVIEVGSGVLPATTAPGPGIATPFTTITFDAEFASPPNVFVMTEENAANADPCTIRIRNITTTGFDAACHEPINADRASGGMIFEYVAVQDGTTSVPLSTSGTVDFVSSCQEISAQQYGPNCAACSGAQSYVGVTFPGGGFTAAPALLTQVQTTNNLVSGEPVFLDTAVRQGSLSATGFDLSLDQMEAGTGPLASTEEVCYLAVERNGCQTLDLSSLGGPASLAFQAQTGGNNVDGHDNACSTGEGVGFAAGCFTTTPIAVAKQVTRNGNNGGLLRRCSVNSSEIVLTFDEDQVSDAERNHIDETASVLAFGSAFTTPVTMAEARAVLRGRWVLFEWSTNAEVFHLGFNLWAEVEGEWVQINRRFIAGDGQDTETLKSYKKRVRLTRHQANKASRFAISSIDSQGLEEFYGPFESGERYGSRTAPDPVDWALVRAEFESMTGASVVDKKHHRRRIGTTATWREPLPSGKSRHGLVEFDVEGEGIRRLSGSDILAAAPGYLGVNLDRVALTLNGAPVARHIVSKDHRLSEDDSVYFVAQPPTGEYAIYLNRYTYRLSLDRRLALDANTFDAGPSDTQSVSNKALTSVKLTRDKLYSASSSGETPWYDSRILAAGSPNTQGYQFDFDVETALPGAIEFALLGGVDFPGATDDHHFRIMVNGTPVHEAWFDGFNAATGRVTVPPGLLQNGVNQVEVVVEGDTGFWADLILVDDLTVSAFTDLESVLEKDIVIPPDSEVIEVTNAAHPDTLVFIYTLNGGLSVANSEVIKDDARLVALPPRITRAPMRLAWGRDDVWQGVAALRYVSPERLPAAPASYVIVAHPNFVGDKLEQFRRFKENQGFTVELVDWHSVVAQFGFGNDTPHALARYLKSLPEIDETRHVLIVGGHSYDYRGLSGQHVVNYIPTFYRAVSVLNFAPTDNPLADLNGDRVPELAIGRWPVRTSGDLSNIVDKTLQWHTLREQQPYQDALLLAQAVDNRNLDFAEQLQGRVAIPLMAMPEFDGVSLIDLDGVRQGAMTIQEARDQVRESIDGGVGLLSFAGHASTAGWGYQGVVDTQFIQSLDNTDTPLIVMPLACYTTNYESTSINTLAHQWLFAGLQGAVAIHGASVLGEYRENALFAERFLRAGAAGATTIGEAILNAKREMVGTNPMLNNWVLLGDPALPLR
ncbi:C25 family cysteine peptidase [Arenicella chitinivorans]|nr:C25 family cysteine peptidase [Arenicella chitinivorans]